MAERKRPRRLAACVAASIVLAFPAVTAGQYPVQGQNGHLLDANPQVGSYGRNYARPVSPLMAGNAIATGNVGRGLALRSYSPINSTTAFRATLGSASLSSFRRDSVSIADYASPYGGLIAQPYYDPAGTAPTAGYLTGQGWTAQGGLGPYSGRAATRSTDARLGPTGPLDLRLDANVDRGIDMRARITGQMSRAGELTSTIFGPRAAPETPDARLDMRLRPEVAGRGLDQEANLFSEELGGLREEEEFPIEAVTPESALDRLLRGEPGTQLLDRDDDGSFLEPFSQSAVRPLAPGAQDDAETYGVAEAARGGRDGLPLSGPSVLPGADMFSDMQMALALRGEPDADWFTEMQSVIREDPSAHADLQEIAGQQAEQFVKTLMETPITTFAGRGASSLNDQMTRAEVLLDEGRYFDAVNRYDAANALDPTNPLPLIGKGHALLAAGDYFSAAIFIIRGLERFPEMARFRVDVGSLLGGGEIVDIRRSDIMRSLENQENTELRFLLGYIEYHTGMRESGLRNLDQAARQAEIGSLIARYPDMIRGEGVLPVPKLPLDTRIEPRGARETAPEGEPPAPTSAPSGRNDSP